MVIQLGGELLMVEYMCDKRWKTTALHAINLCGNCYNLRQAERDESQVTNVRREDHEFHLQNAGEICSREVVSKGTVA